MIPKIFWTGQPVNLPTEEARTANKVLPKAGVKCFYDTFVLNRTLVFQINSSAETPRLRQYPNRYLQWQMQHPNNSITLFYGHKKV